MSKLQKLYPQKIFEEATRHIEENFLVDKIFKAKMFPNY